MGPWVFPRSPLEDLKQSQSQFRPGSSGNHSTPSRAQPDFSPSLEKLKFIPSEYPKMALSFTVQLVGRASIQSWELCEKYFSTDMNYDNLG